MKIAIASGKGGTGKTMITASLASVWGSKVLAVDLDVEEPNLHLFLKPKITGSIKAEDVVPILDKNKCDACGRCAEFCKFKALSLMAGILLIFPEMCHACGGCFRVCPKGALLEGKRELGEILWGKSSDNIDFIMGKLRIGEAMSPPLMREVKTQILKILPNFKTDMLIDAPPGTSCPAINAVMDSDFIALVTEPTPFGVNDLKLVVEAFKPLNKPMGVIVNRAGVGDDAVYNYCVSANLPILAKIPFAKEIAAAYSEGKVISEISPSYKKIFELLAREIKSYA